MEFRPLELSDRVTWARLLAVCFDRSPEQMEALLAWFHTGFPLVTMGAWDGEALVAQYNCRLLELRVPGVTDPLSAGMGLNMAVDPAYRGRGLLDRVATPVHEIIAERGCVAGVGFSSTGGLAVTRASRSYAYEVLGPMVSTVVAVTRPRRSNPLRLSTAWPSGPIAFPEGDDRYVRYAVTPASLHHRFAEHPFRRYAYATRACDDIVNGLVVYRRVTLRGLPAASLLAAYGEDLPDLLGRWAAALRTIGLHVVHLVTSPGSPLRDASAAIGPRVVVPFSRNPYHLITRALQPDTPPILFDLGRWDAPAATSSEVAVDDEPSPRDPAGRRTGTPAGTGSSRHDRCGHRRPCRRPRAGPQPVHRRTDLRPDPRGHGRGRHQGGAARR